MSAERIGNFCQRNAEATGRNNGHSRMSSGSLRKTKDVMKSGEDRENTPLLGGAKLLKPHMVMQRLACSARRPHTTLTMRDGPYGGLKVRFAGSPGGPVVVLLHGFGAPGDDLVPLARALGAPAGALYAFPEAPLELRFPGMWNARAWWMIDMARVERAIASGDNSEFIVEVPEGLPSSRAKLCAMLDELEAEVGFDGGLYLGGFSQGAMLSCDVALHTDRPLAGLILMVRSHWTLRERLTRPKALKGRV